MRLTDLLLPWRRSHGPLRSPVPPTVPWKGPVDFDRDEDRPDSEAPADRERD